MPCDAQLAGPLGQAIGLIPALSCDFFAIDLNLAGIIPGSEADHQALGSDRLAQTQKSVPIQHGENRMQGVIVVYSMERAVDEQPTGNLPYGG